ncbi:MAG: type II secretion system F family protein, partial [Phycisphaerales bacterium]|nr:type II secretion system F family protein [Phycisphaerales bacterium]
MPQYRFQVKSQDGKVQSGVMSADSAAAAATVLRNQGVYVMSVDEQKAGVGKGGLGDLFASINNKKPTQKNVLDFTTQLAVMIRAGINLRAALDGIADQTDHKTFKKIINQLKADVESGKQFSD